MGTLLLALLLVLPLIELYVIVQVAAQIGGLQTLALLVGISLAGAWLCKRQGVGVLRRLNRQLDLGQLPANEILDGALLLLAGAFLLVPGFVTAAVGLLLLVPPLRVLVRRVSLTRLQRRVDLAVTDLSASGAGFRFVRFGGPVGSARTTVVDTVGVEVDDRPAPGPRRPLPPGPSTS